MRIAFPTDDEQLIAGHAGRCRGFAVYDVENGQSQKVEFRPNTFTGHARGLHPQGGHDTGMGHSHHEGHTHHSHSDLVEALSDCNEVIACGMGPRLIDDLATGGIAVRFSRNRDIQMVVEAVASGSFEESPGGSACHKANE
ncbi:MAG: NifB/NifX family molybdenum-iron cluster-binding protein [Calditrichota bacterium]